MSNRPNVKKRALPPRPSTAAKGGPSIGLVIGIVVAALLVVAAIAIGLTATGVDSDAGPQTMPVEVSGTLTPMPTGGTDPAVGQAAPTVTGTVLVGSDAGQSVTIGNDGRAKLTCSRGLG